VDAAFGVFALDGDRCLVIGRSESDGINVSAIMRQKVMTISPRESPGYAAHMMIKHDIGRLPVIEEGKMIGIFSRSDAVADFYGLCPLGNRFSSGCEDRIATLT